MSQPPDHALNDLPAQRREQYMWLSEPTGGDPLARRAGESWPAWRERIRGVLPIEPTGWVAGWEKFPVPDHSQLQACVASAVSAAIQLRLWPTTELIPSVPFIYYVARYLIGDEDRNKGISTYNALKGCFYFGFCSDDLWPLASKPAPEARPDQSAVDDARTRGIDTFSYFDRNAYQDLFLSVCKYAITSNYSVIFTASVTDDFLKTKSEGGYLYNRAQRGLVEVPRPAETAPNRHCLVAVGYDDAYEGGCFKVRDSFDAEKGDNGYLWMPYVYFEEDTDGGAPLTNNFWIVQDVIDDISTNEEFAKRRDSHWQRLENDAMVATQAYARYKPPADPDAFAAAVKRLAFPPSLV